MKIQDYSKRYIEMSDHNNGTEEYFRGCYVERDAFEVGMLQGISYVTQWLEKNLDGGYITNWGYDINTDRILRDIESSIEDLKEILH